MFSDFCARGNRVLGDLHHANQDFSVFVCFPVRYLCDRYCKHDGLHSTSFLQYFGVHLGLFFVRFFGPGVLCMHSMQQLKESTSKLLHSTFLVTIGTDFFFTLHV